MPVKKNYTEAEMIDTFGLTRLVSTQTPRMVDWLDAELPVLTPFESYLFEIKFKEVKENVIGWNEEELKMEFISPLMIIVDLKSTDKYRVFYERNLAHTIEGNPLSVKVDYMIATGILDLYKKPYFYFQEYKPQKRPSGDSMGQLLQAMMIAQATNSDEKPIYGCEIIGSTWNFVILESKTYCISKKYDCTERNELLQIIAILRKFKHILETELIVD
ncbi:MAG: hypothetical protein RLZZ292_1834 [Bacteroidota bacterium]|jgi:hypothetical protein